MNWNDIAKKQYAWVERMGWHNKTVLESLALIGSEIGEAANECLDGEPTSAFGEELADIVLRTADLAHDQGINLDAVIAQANGQTWRSMGLAANIAETTVDFAHWVNTARGLVLGPDFGLAMGRVVQRVVGLACHAKVNLELEVNRKMKINEERGTRGRLV